MLNTFPAPWRASRASSFLPFRTPARASAGRPRPCRRSERLDDDERLAGANFLTVCGDNLDDFRVVGSPAPPYAIGLNVFITSINPTGCPALTRSPTLTYGFGIERRRR